ncbi:hypothetical protein HY78_00410 [Rhizorhabdus wittichii DC-6]|nr:hypothetical protein HY78_00410 [Rhizorhabdus wittichii DC-6]
MTETNLTRPSATIGSWAALSNMARALDTMNAAIHAEDGAPRMCVFFGKSGVGKTVGAAYVTARTGAAYILARSVWTRRAFLEALATEIGIASLERTATRLMDQIIEQLQAMPRPLLIDEMDHLARNQAVEIIRDIYDATDIPVMMIGEEKLPGKLKEWERFDNRLIAINQALPASVEDGRLLRDVYCKRVHVADDLVDFFTERCKGITRRIIINLQRANTVAVDELGTTAIDLKSWGNRPMLNGAPTVIHHHHTSH